MTPSQRRLAQELGIENAVHVLPKLTRNVLAAVYRHSDLLMHTADGEGFGLPLIEAMACGCPVVASDLPVLREVGGMAAAYCPVADVSVWKETVVRLLREKLEKRGAWELRRQQAIEYAAQFSWAENAQQTVRIYQQVLSGKQPD
jgi:glycosyltransferase involved in cell wall biosynthesis